VEQPDGISPIAIESSRLRSVTFEIADLPDAQLAVTTATLVKIDLTAAAYGWYVDYFPQDDTKFTLSIFDRELQADLDSPAFGRMDLLTVMQLHKTDLDKPIVSLRDKIRRLLKEAHCPLRKSDACQPLRIALESAVILTRLRGVLL
jgi:hypothetical protein